tara:strand:- start:41 stop:154 length:114 start_codon:yes stop_codon:yes gene_type:complete
MRWRGDVVLAKGGLTLMAEAYSGVTKTADFEPGQGVL